MDMDDEIYEECRSIARILMSRSYEGHTLRPTELVHEGLIRIHRSGNENVTALPPVELKALFATAMKHHLIDHQRRKQAEKHGGKAVRVAIPRDIAFTDADVLDLVLVDQVFAFLEAHDPQLSQLLMLRWFGGLTIEETASRLGLGTRTVSRRWDSLRAMLRTEFDPQGPSSWAP